MEHLNRFLVDAYAMLVKGEIQNESLRASAEAAFMYIGDRSRTALITNETMRNYEGAIRAIIAAVSTVYIGKIPALETLLCSTPLGRQGVPPVNMMLNLWRYFRKMTAKELVVPGSSRINSFERERSLFFMRTTSR
jgi:hypothetical protein